MTKTQGIRKKILKIESSGVFKTKKRESFKESSGQFCQIL